MISEYCIYYQNSRRALTFIYLKSVQPNLVMLWLPGIKNTVKQQIPSIFILMNRRECVKIACNKFFAIFFYLLSNLPGLSFDFFLSFRQRINKSISFFGSCISGNFIKCPIENKFFVFVNSSE